MRGFQKLSLVQAKLYLREPMAAFFTLLFGPTLFILLGFIFGNSPDPMLAGQGYLDRSVSDLYGDYHQYCWVNSLAHHQRNPAGDGCTAPFFGYTTTTVHLFSYRCARAIRDDPVGHPAPIPGGNGHL